MKFSLQNILLVSISLGQITKIDGRAIPALENLAVRSEQLDARGNCLSCVKPKPGVKPNPAPRPVVPSVPDPVPGPTVPEPSTPGPAIGPSGTKPGKTFPSWTVNYKPRKDNNEPWNLDAKAVEWLTAPLEAAKVPLSQKYTTFSIESKKGHSQPVDKAVFKARYSVDSVFIESMYKDTDANKPADKIPTSELMAQGAVQAKSKPNWVYMKKVANAATRNTLLDGLQEKYGKGQIVDKTWTISSSSTEAIDKKYFDLVMKSDNGRPVRDFCRFHPELVDGKTVTEIVVKGDDHSKLLFILGKA